MSEEWRSSWLHGANCLFLCKLRCCAKVQLHRFRYSPCGTIVYDTKSVLTTLISLCYYNPDSVSNQILRHSWKTLSTLLFRGRCRIIRGEAQYTLMLIAHVQTCGHAHFQHLLEIMMATSHTRAENVTFSQEIGEVAAISAGIFA